MDFVQWLENELVAAELVRLFASDAPVPTKDKPKRKTDAQLTQVRRQLVRLDEAYEAGAYTVTEYSGKRKELRAREAELLDVEKQAAQAQREAGEQARTIKTMRELSAHFADWIKDADPREVKHHLSRVVRIVVYPDKTVRVRLV